MLLRRMMAALCPVLLCVLLCAAFGWLDGQTAVSGFIVFALKGLALGLCLALALPIAGIRSYTNGISGWLLASALLILLALIVQYLNFVGVLKLPNMLIFDGMGGQAVMAEGAFVAFLGVTALINRRR